MTVLSVNVNKIAVLRNSRGGVLPSPLAVALLCVEAGARGITVHPRPDARHITATDVAELAAKLPAGIELNIEGNPFALPRPGYPGLMALVEQVRPAQVTFVPDADGQITSDHGFDPKACPPSLVEQIGACRSLGARVSLFVGPGETELEPFLQAGAQRIEIYTGPYAEAWAAAAGSAAAPAAVQSREDALSACRRTAAVAQALGLGVNAGHDLSQQNLAAFLSDVPDVLEVSIGHALVSEALIDGLSSTVRRYLALTGG